MRNLCRTPRTRNSAKSSTMPKRTSPFSSRLAGAIGIAGTAPSWGATALYTYATAASLRAHPRAPSTADAWLWPPRVSPAQRKRLIRDKFTEAMYDRDAMIKQDFAG